MATEAQPSSAGVSGLQNPLESEGSGPSSLHHEIPHVENPFEEKVGDDTEEKRKMSNKPAKQVGFRDPNDAATVPKEESNKNKSQLEIEHPSQEAKEEEDDTFEEPGEDPYLAQRFVERFPLEPGLIHTWSTEEQTSGDGDDMEDAIEDDIDPTELNDASQEHESKLDGVHHLATEMNPIAHIDEEAVQDALIQAAEDAMRFAYEETARKQAQQQQQGDTFIQHQLAELLVRQRQSLLRLGEMETRLETMESLIARTLHCVVALDNAREREERLRRSTQSSVGRGSSRSVLSAPAQSSDISMREGSSMTLESTASQEGESIERSQSNAAWSQTHTPSDMSGVDSAIATMLPVPPPASVGASTPRDGTWLLAKILSIPHRAMLAGAVLRDFLKATLIQWIGQDSWDQAVSRLQTFLRRIAEHTQWQRDTFLGAANSLWLRMQEKIRHIQVLPDTEEEKKLLLVTAISSVVVLAYLLRRRANLQNSNLTSKTIPEALMPASDRISVTHAILMT